MYLYAVEKFAINSITHKYLIRGHTQNEGDAVHSVIEKSLKKAKNSGPIYVPDQYIAIIRNAKKRGNPYKVIELSYQDFVDLKILSDELKFNYTKNTNGEQIKISEVKMLRFVKGDSLYYYKNSYKQENWEEVQTKLGTRQSEIITIKDVTLKNAYKAKLEISDKKRDSFSELLKTNMIPKFYETFYSSLF